MPLPEPHSTPGTGRPAACTSKALYTTQEAEVCSTEGRTCCQRCVTHFCCLAFNSLLLQILHVTYCTAVCDKQRLQCILYIVSKSEETVHFIPSKCISGLHYMSAATLVESWCEFPSQQMKSWQHRKRPALLHPWNHSHQRNLKPLVRINAFYKLKFDCESSRALLINN